MSIKSNLLVEQEIESIGPVIGQCKKCKEPVRSILIKDINIIERFYCEGCDTFRKEPNIKGVNSEK